MPKDMRPLLTTTNLFRNLDAAVVDRSVALGERRHLATDAVLFRKGDAGDALYRTKRGQ